MIERLNIGTPVQVRIEGEWMDGVVFSDIESGFWGRRSVGVMVNHPTRVAYQQKAMIFYNLSNIRRAE